MLPQASISPAKKLPDFVCLSHVPPPLKGVYNENVSFYISSGAGCCFNLQHPFRICGQFQRYGQGRSGHPGQENAVKLVSKPDGYYQNPDIKIPLPESVQKVEKDSFELSMNRAAERAAPEAKSIFGDAITQMTFDDAKKILNGQDNEATLYFEDKTSARLQEVFKPIVKDAMGEVGVTQSFQDLNARAESMPFGKSLSFDLDQYVTDGALKGLFEMLAEEEKRIRTEPAARVTDLLKKVFASQ
jgi:hypothetical protein